MKKFPRSIDDNKPSLQFLDPDHHVQMALTVLFDDISYIIRLSSLLKLPSGNEVLDLPDATDRVLVRVG